MDFSTATQLVLVNHCFCSVVLLGVVIAELVRGYAEPGLLFLIGANGVLLSLYAWLGAGPLRSLDGFEFRLVVWPMYVDALAFTLALVAVLLPG